jgi:hypothetical protein
MGLSEEYQRLFEAAAPGNPTSGGSDRVLEREYARLDLAATRTVKFAYLYPESFIVDGGTAGSEVGDGLTLALYPADTLTQARALYADLERVQGLLGLRHQGWQLRPNFHFGYMEKGFTWTTSPIEVEAYIDYWTARIHNLHPYPRDEWDAKLGRLIADGIFSPDDEAQFNADFRQTNRPEAYPRPAVAVSHSWDATRSSDSGFPSELRAALRQVLTALKEPMTTLGGKGAVPLGTEAGVGPVSAERTQRSAVFGVEGERQASAEYLRELDVLRVGPLAEAKEYLEQHLHSNRFYVEGDRAWLELPNRTNGPPDHVLLVWFRMPEAIAIGGPSGGSRMGLHAIPAGWDATLCRIPTASWKGGTRYRPGREVECRWCLVRLLAAEVIRGASVPEVTQQVTSRNLTSEKSDPPLYPLQRTRKDVLKSGAVLMDFQENRKPESRSRITTRVIQNRDGDSKVTIYIGRRKWGPPFLFPFPEIPSPEMVWDLTLDKISS